MHLHEEYIRRHNLDVPVIRYNAQSNIFLRYNNPRKWRIASFNWQTNIGHPGFWNCSLMEPVHSSFGRFRNWKELLTKREIFWDQYEDFIKKLAGDFCEWEVAEGDLDCELFCWEVFLYICDTWISNSSLINSQRFLKSMSGSLDENLSLMDRWERFQDAILMVKNPSVMEFYNYNICNYLIDNDTKWFSELINNESKKIFPRAS